MINLLLQASPDKKDKKAHHLTPHWMPQTSSASPFCMKLQTNASQCPDCRPLSLQDPTHLPIDPPMPEAPTCIGKKKKKKEHKAKKKKSGDFCRAQGKMTPIEKGAVPRDHSRSWLRQLRLTAQVKPVKLLGTVVTPWLRQPHAVLSCHLDHMDT